MRRLWPTGGLWRHPDFLKLWSATTVSQFGTQISQLALPLLAVLVLDASAFEVAALGTVEFLPFMLFTLPAGVLVFPAISLVQTSDAFPAPDEFRPERFLDGSAPPYTFIPFGGGPRRCIGASFAIMEMKTVLSTVVKQIELRAADRRAEKPRVHHVTQVPARGARVVARAR